MRYKERLNLCLESFILCAVCLSFLLKVFVVFYLFRWVFSQLYDKGLVYRGVKVMPFSTACNTPLSNFESHQNYKVCKNHNPLSPQLAYCSTSNKICGLDVNIKNDLISCFLFFPPGCSGPVCDCQLPIGWE